MTDTETTEEPMDTPTLRLLSLGAGVQSSALLLLAARGDLPKLDGAIFADTGWEPRAVYEHLERLDAEVAKPAGIPIYRVSSGNIRNDALDPEHRFASMPLYIKNPDGSDGMARRQCTNEYKLTPIKRTTRKLLGYVHPTPVPKGVYAEQWIGISTDEADRAERRPNDVRYTRNRFPLLELGMTREDCRTLLRHHGFGQTPKSACVGCPYHGNAFWRRMREETPEEFADAVDFDRQIRGGSARANAQGQQLRGQAFLHRARVPLDEAPVERVTASEWSSRQTDLVQLLDLQAYEETLDPDTITGCSPFGCSTGEDVIGDSDDDEGDVELIRVGSATRPQ